MVSSCLTQHADNDSHLVLPLQENGMSEATQAEKFSPGIE